MTTTRRAFIGGAASVAAAAGLATVLPPGTAMASAPERRSGTLDDVEHVVILMQENRSVDHYYGTMRGVRGFGDTTALRLPNGADVFHQPALDRPEGYLLPYRADTYQVDSQDLTGNDHSWDGVHEQWAQGRNIGFYEDSGATSLAYFAQADVPFNRALAKAFTFCDHYFCSIKGPTTPNRLFHWTGMIDPGGTQGGPAIYNPNDYLPVFNWTTYPERLQAAGVSWQVFANDEVGDGGGEDGFVGDYGDNPLWLFQAYHDALDSTDPAVRQLAARASVRKTWKPNSGLGHHVDHVLAEFIARCAAGTLPKVSWVVAPYAYSEHPAARPVDGAAYTQTVLNAVWGNEKLRDNTVVLINYDEHDGFFDHVIPPTAPNGTPGEFVEGRPVGLGPRVPMIAVSPWSRGGWINSQVFDHTSVLRFLENWTGVHEPNISAWRREICGDLMSCFDFSSADTTIPTLPDTAVLRRKADQLDSTLPEPTPPAPGEQVHPTQEAGTAPARPLPYQPSANVLVDGTTLRVRLANTGTATVQVQVYDHAVVTANPQRYDLAAGAVRNVRVATTGTYDLAVHGPNGFLRTAIGGPPTSGIDVSVTITGTASDPALRLDLVNRTSRAVTASVRGAGDSSGAIRVSPGTHSIELDPIADSHGWYDIRVGINGHTGFARRFAGHLENGLPSITG